MNTIGKNKKTWTVFAVFVGIYVLLMVCYLVGNYSINELVGLKAENVDGVLDLQYYDPDNAYKRVSLKGDWEFYYNKWIVTDDLTDAEPDAMLPLNNRWTSLKLDGKRLPNTGYASYKLTVKNFPEGTILRIANGRTFVPYRAFINGEVLSDGAYLSKEEGESYSYNENNMYSFDPKPNTEYEIVIEIGNTDFGGLVKTPLLFMAPSKRIGYTYNIASMAPYFIGFFLCLIVVSVIFSLAAKDFKLCFGTVSMLIVLAVWLMLSTDFAFLFVDGVTVFNVQIIKPFSYTTVPYKSLILGGLSFAVYFCHVLLSKYVRPNKKELIIFVSATAVTTLTGALLHGRNVQIPFLYAASLAYFYIIYMLTREYFTSKNANNLAFASIGFLILVYTQMQIFELCGVTRYLNGGFSVVTMSVVLVFILVMFFIIVMNNTRQALKTVRLEKELRELQLTAASVRIKPHFIFNSLLSIQELYKMDAQTGEKMLTMFSRHLRNYVEAERRGLITIYEEIENAQNYFELENIRTGGKLQLLIDIDEDLDIRVPQLSIQPLVENAIKYAGTQDKEDGYIQIKAYIDAKARSKFIEVIDNGKGFDVNAIGKKSTGIDFTRKLLKHSLDAEMTIDSKINEGTTVRIIIPDGDGR